MSNRLSDDERRMLVEEIKRDILAELRASQAYDTPAGGRLASSFATGGADLDGTSSAQTRGDRGATTGFIYGVGTAALALLLFPSLRERFYSVAVKTVEETMELSDQFVTLISNAKKDVENIIAEAQFNSLRKKFIDRSDESSEGNMS